MCNRRKAAVVGALIVLLLAIVRVGHAQTAVGNFLHVFLNGNRLSATAGTAVVTVPNSTDTLVGKATSDALTNKTIDAEGTGNVVSVALKQWIAAGVCTNVTATAPLWSFPTADAAASSCNTGSNTQKATLDFADGGSALSVQTAVMLPSDWTATGGVDVRLKWFASTATSGAVVWQVAAICVADAETSDPAFNTASTVTDTAKGTINQDNDATITGLTVTGCAAGELLYLKVLRDPAHGSDTLADTAQLRGIEITYRRAM